MISLKVFLQRSATAFHKDWKESRKSKWKFVVSNSIASMIIFGSLVWVINLFFDSGFLSWKIFAICWGVALLLGFPASLIQWGMNERRFKRNEI